MPWRAGNFQALREIIAESANEGISIFWEKHRVLTQMLIRSNKDEHLERNFRAGDRDSSLENPFDKLENDVRIFYS